MPVLNKVVQLAIKPFPSAISEKGHAIADYANVGIFLIAVSSFWRRNKRAAIGALISATAALAVNLLTDYPGGAKKVIHYRRHRDIDFGLAALAATTPEFLAFEETPERRFFIAEGMAISAITQLTKFPEKSRFAKRERAA